MRNILPAAGVAIPFVYFADLFGVGAISPGFDHGAELPSELGREGMPNAALFNLGLIAVGICALLASVGLWLGLRATGANFILSLLAAITVACLGVGMVMAGAFPLPNPSCSPASLRA